MKFRDIATRALLGSLLGAISAGAFADDSNACATLVGAASSATPQGFQLRDGEPVDFVGGGKSSG